MHINIEYTLIIFKCKSKVNFYNVLTEANDVKLNAQNLYFENVFTIFKIISKQR